MIHNIEIVVPANKIDKENKRISLDLTSSDQEDEGVSEKDEYQEFIKTAKQKILK